MLFVILVAPVAIECEANLRVKKITRTFHHYLKKLAELFQVSSYVHLCNQLQQATGDRRKANALTLVLLNNRKKPEA